MNKCDLEKMDKLFRLLAEQMDKLPGFDQQITFKICFSSRRSMVNEVSHQNA